MINSVHPKWKVTEEDLNALDAAQRNSGGVKCVQVALNIMRRGDIMRGAGILQSDGDKIRSYPKVEIQVRRMFGCYLHFVPECGNEFFCKRYLSKDSK